MQYIIIYNDRNGLNGGEIKIKGDKQLESGLNAALGRIGASFPPLCRCELKDGAYNFQRSHKYVGIVALKNSQNKTIQFPKNLHDKLIK